MDIYRSAGITTNESVPDRNPVVRLTHIPTGISVENESTWSQFQNKEAAWRELDRKVTDLD